MHALVSQLDDDEECLHRDINKSLDNLENDVEQIEWNPKLSVAQDDRRRMEMETGKEQESKIEKTAIVSILCGFFFRSLFKSVFLS